MNGIEREKNAMKMIPSIGNYSEIKMCVAHFSANFHFVCHTVYTLTVECTFSYEPCFALIHQMLELFSPVRQQHFENPVHPKHHCAATANPYSMLVIRCCLNCCRAIYHSLYADLLHVASETVGVVNGVVVVAVVVAAANFEAVESLSMVDADHERQRDRCEFVELSLSDRKRNGRKIRILTMKIC